MAKKKKNIDESIVYSTNPAYSPAEAYEVPDTLPPEEQQLRVQREKKGRGGKEVTIVRGFIGTEGDLKLLGKLIKKSCGVGGTTKDNEIIIQGNHVDTIIEILKTTGYKVRKSGG